MPGLLDPITVGDLHLPNRVWMAPLTRCRAGGGGRVPNPLMAEYYAQRASAGLILTEATVVDPMGIGYPDTPGIWSPEQVEGWKLVTRAVHDRGGRIFLQLWHVGRMSHPIYLDGKLPVAPSAIRPEGHPSLLRPKQSFETPRALELSEIPGIIEAFRKGAQHAQAAGFDGVEIHGANGYLVDQFLQDGANHRTDEYGGPIENRARFLLEVADAAISVWGPGRVGMHLAPRGDIHSIGDSNPAATFGHVARELGRRRIAFICAERHSARAGSALSSRTRSAGSTSPTSDSPGRPASRSSRPARPTRSRTECSSSRIPTCPAASRWKHRSTIPIPPRSTRRDPKATSIIPRWRPRKWPWLMRAN